MSTRVIIVISDHLLQHLYKCLCTRFPRATSSRCFFTFAIVHAATVCCCCYCCSSSGRSETKQLLQYLR